MRLHNDITDNTNFLLLAVNLYYCQPLPTLYAVDK